MDDKNNFENSLKIMRVGLLISGIKTSSNPWHFLIEVFINSCLFYFNFIVLYTVIFGEIAWLVEGIQIGRSFVELSLALPLITITIMGTVKSFYLYLGRDVVCEIIDTLKEIHPKIEKDFEENDVVESQKNIAEITKESVKMLNIVVNLLKVVSGSVLVMFLLAPLSLMFLEHFSKGETGVSYPFAVKYWFDVYDTKWWPVLYLHQVVATIIVCMNLFGSEVLFYVICTYIEMHFRILCHRLEGIRLVSSRQIKEELDQCIVKHQQLIFLVDQAELLFSKPALFHIVSSSFLICLSAFNITVTEDMKTMFAFVSFLLLTLSQVSLICFFGDKLMKSSTEVSGAAYNCPWYDFDVQTKKAILIIIMRARKPCKLTAANFAELNLQAFTTILSRSWSYFALLKTVYK